MAGDPAQAQRLVVMPACSVAAHVTAREADGGAALKLDLWRSIGCNAGSSAMCIGPLIDEMRRRSASNAKTPQDLTGAGAFEFWWPGSGSKKSPQPAPTLAFFTLSDFLGTPLGTPDHPGFQNPIRTPFGLSILRQRQHGSTPWCEDFHGHRRCLGRPSFEVTLAKPISAEAHPRQCALPRLPL